jgi:hypothetical protein
VPRERIVANIFLPMLGRGGASDVPGGGPAYLEAHDADRLSTELGALVDAVNARTDQPFARGATRGLAADRNDATCSGDHWHFARWGVPSVAISTGLHADYARVTDDVSRVDFDKLARVTRYVAALTAEIANRPARLAIDSPKPDPRTPCER